MKDVRNPAKDTKFDRRIHYRKEGGYKVHRNDFESHVRLADTLTSVHTALLTTMTAFSLSKFHQDVVQYARVASD